MTSERGEGFGFAVAHDAPIPYMQRIRDYYVTLGYGTPYEWAHYAKVPFQPRGDRPVYCSDCFSRQRGGSGRSSYR